MGLDAGDVLVRLGEPRTDLVHDLVRRLGEERLVAELGVRLGLLLLRGGEVLGEPLALGRDIDRAGEVERHRGPGDGKRRRRREGLALRLQPQQLTDGRLVRGEGGAVQREAGRNTLAGLETLVGTEAADLRDDLLKRLDLTLGARVAETGVGRPLGDDDRLAAGQRRPQRLGDEGDDRVQEAQGDVEDLAQDSPGDLRRLRRPP